jgi:MPBQ/MSBQ methyltransferase
LIVTDAERDEVRAYLERAYAGVFGPAEIAFHLSSHLGDAFADYACQVVTPSTPAGGRILDVGCGFGSFVVLARERGFEAIGAEIADYEIAFARRRLARLRPGDSPADVFLAGGIFNPALDARRFDAITFWNVLEHVEHIRPLVERAASLLAPGGAVYAVCPNYAAFRNEAHYQVPWRPGLSRAAAVRRLREHGKDPRFFETSIFQRTNWEVMRVMRAAGLTLYDRMNQVPMGLPALFTSPRQFRDFFNPLRPAVELAARKPR